MCRDVERGVERDAERGVDRGVESVEETRIPIGSKRSSRVRLASILLLAGLLCLFAPGVASAKDSPARKLGRGFGNLTLGVLAIPSEIIDTTRERGPAVGVTWGLIKGTGMMVATQAVGVWEVLTCPFATPPDYRPILDPEFPWQRFTHDEQRNDDRKAKRARSAIADAPRGRE